MRFFCFGAIFLWAQQRKQDHIADGLGSGENHGEPVDADAFAAGWRQAVGESANVILVHLVGFFVAALALRDLLLKTAALLLRIVQLAKSVANLQSADEESKRSTQSGSSGFCFDSGEMARGKS